MDSSTHSQPPRHWVIIPAAGVGRRMQSEVPKQYLQIGHQTVLKHTLSLFESDTRFAGVAIGVSEEDPYISLVLENGHEKLRTFIGGAERADTVLNGLKSETSASSDDWVWVHDAARPCLSKEDVDAIFMRLTELGSERDLPGLILASPIVDTIKYSHDGELVDKTIDRTTLWRAYTPQVFRYKTLMDALVKAQDSGLAITDESSAIEALGKKVSLLEGRQENIKITRPDDLAEARQTLFKQGRLGSSNQEDRELL